jgi:hypothetical protein
VQTEVLQDRGELQTPLVKSKWTGSALMLTAIPTNPRPGLPQEKPRPVTSVSIPVRQQPAATTQPQAVAARPQITVTAAPYGQYGSNGNVRMKVLDAEQKMTGFYVTLEAENNAATTIDPYYLSLDCYAKGYFLQKIAGSGLRGESISQGQKTKIEFSTVEKPDEVQIKFPKPGWQPIKLRLSGDDDPVVSEVNQAAASPLGQVAPYGEYASNGFVRMKLLDAEQKMTGYFMTVELANDTQAGIEPWNISFNYSKDGYSVGTSTGSGVYGAEGTIPAGRRGKLQFSATTPVDTIVIKFPKPNWQPLTLHLN